MAKLGYTWYPKDWGNSESVFELNLSERGLYRELIDLAMLNDNKTEIKKDVWCRKFDIDIISLNSILNKLYDLKLIEINSELLFIPSCESRLIYCRTGSIGGKNKGKSKGNSKGLHKGSIKGNVNQIEIEREKKDNVNESEPILPSPPFPCIENETYQNKPTTFKQAFSDYWNNQTALEAIAMRENCTVDDVKNSLVIFKEELKSGGLKPDDFKLDFGKHFNNWLNKPHGKETLKKKHALKSAMELISERERSETKTA
jgi:hypothetical protein